MKKFFSEFKEFAFKGSMIDLAIGMIIGSAFTTVVNALVENIFNPFIGLLTGGVNLADLWKVRVGAEVITDGVDMSNYICFGAFVSALVKFILVAFVLFLIVRGINKVREAEEKLKNRKAGPNEETAPTTKVCPYCKSVIDIDATRCPHCTSELKS